MKQWSIHRKIMVMSTTLIVILALAFWVTIILQRGWLEKQMSGLVQEQGLDECSKIVQAVYLNCEAAEARNQARLTHDLGIAREIMGRMGTLAVSPETSSPRRRRPSSCRKCCWARPGWARITRPTSRPPWWTRSGT
jgi:hypothetical protein